MSDSKEKKRFRDKRYYQNHKEEIKAKKEEYYQEHREEMLARSVKYRKKNRGKILARSREYRRQNKEEVAKIQRNHNQKRRMEALCHYGGNSPRCSCCNEPLIEFLAIDHINGNGAQHRREIKGTSGHSFYSWLKKNDYPEGFRVLCHNCNSSLGYYGYCPHKKEVQL